MMFISSSYIKLCLYARCFRGVFWQLRASMYAVQHCVDAESDCRGSESHYRRRPQALGQVLYGEAHSTCSSSVFHSHTLTVMLSDFCRKLHPFVFRQHHVGCAFIAVNHMTVLLSYYSYKLLVLTVKTIVLGVFSMSFPAIYGWLTCHNTCTII